MRTPSRIEYDLKRYAERRKQGICPSCGKPTGGKSYCPECRKMHTDSNRRSRQKRIAEGRCPDCGKKLEEGYEYIACGECREKHRNLMRARSGKEKG